MRLATTSQPTTGRAIGYVRVSTTEQVASGLGLDAQRHSLNAYASRQGWTLAAIHADEGQSGAAPLNERAGLLSAVQSLAPGDTLIVAKLDRLSRGDAIEAAIIEELIDRRRARVLSAAGEGTEHQDDPSAQLQRSIVQMFASYERGMIAARTRAALAAKKARGERVGTEPYGRTDAERRAVAVIEECRAAGYSHRETAEELNRQGFTTRRGSAWRWEYVRSIERTRAGQPRRAASTSPRRKSHAAALAILTR